MVSMTESAGTQQAKRSLWDDRRARLGLFVGTYMVASVVSTSLPVFPTTSPTALMKVVNCGTLFGATSIGLVLLGFGDALVCWGGLIVFGIITWLGTQTQSRRNLAMLYTFFVILLILNGIRWGIVLPKLWEDFLHGLQYIG